MLAIPHGHWNQSNWSATAEGMLTQGDLKEQILTTSYTPCLK